MHLLSTFLRSKLVSGNTPSFFMKRKQVRMCQQRGQTHVKLCTSEQIVNASAIIPNPASILRIFLTLVTAIRRLDTINAMPTGSFSSADDKDDEAGPVREYWALVVSRFFQVFKNLPRSFEGGLSSSRI
jgi:hypothetical protein